MDGMVADEEPTHPRSLADPDALAKRLARIHEPHVEPLNRLAAQIRSSTGDLSVPWFDPSGGGIGARVLILLETPGPNATTGGRSQRPSGIISRDNNDATASNMFGFLRDAGIPRQEIVSWNAVPWYLGSTEKIRAA